MRTSILLYYLLSMVVNVVLSRVFLDRVSIKNKSDSASLIRAHRPSAMFSLGV
jgi:hypothetical protein